MFAKFVFAESFCVPGGASYLAALSRIDWVTPFLDAKLNALVVTQGYYLEDGPVAYPLNVKSLPRFNTIRSFLSTISLTKIPRLSRRASLHSGDLLLKSPAIRDLKVISYLIILVILFKIRDSEVFLKEEDLGLNDLERIVGREVAAVHTYPRHLHPNEPHVGLQEVPDAQIRVTNKDPSPP